MLLRVGIGVFKTDVSSAALAVGETYRVRLALGIETPDVVPVIDQHPLVVAAPSRYAAGLRGTGMPVVEIPQRIRHFAAYLARHSPLYVVDMIIPVLEPYHIAVAWREFITEFSLKFSGVTLLSCHDIDHVHRRGVEIIPLISHRRKSGIHHKSPVSVPAVGSLDPRQRRIRDEHRIPGGDVHHYRIVVLLLLLECAEILRRSHGTVPYPDIKLAFLEVHYRGVVGSDHRRHAADKTLAVMRKS